MLEFDIQGDTGSMLEFDIVDSLTGHRTFGRCTGSGSHKETIRFGLGAYEAQRWDGTQDGAQDGAQDGE